MIMSLLPDTRRSGAHTGTTVPNVASESDRDVECGEVLRLWLGWNEAFETATASMFDGTPKDVEERLDRLDYLRSRAVERSVRLITQLAASTSEE